MDPVPDPTSHASSTTHQRIAVLVPAAGQGVRLGGTRKQFRHLGGRSLLVQTLSIFEHHPGVDDIIVACPADAVEQVRARVGGLTKVRAVVTGGATRQDSVAAALARVPGGVDVVLVHDAVRPFVQPQHIQQVIDMAREAGGAALAVPLADTLRKGDGVWLGKTISRDHLYRMQTPQGFRLAWLQEAHAWARETGTICTDEVALVQQTGQAVRLVPGSERNFKVTTHEDWTLAQLLWSDHEQT